MTPNQSESQILADIRLALGKRDDCVMWRNHTGVAEVENRKQRFGLVKGGADLIGFVDVRLTRAVKHDAIDALWNAAGHLHAPMVEVPFTLGRFTALEVKTPRGRVSDEQKKFIALVNAHGGYACVVRSVDDAVRAVEASGRGDRA